MDPFAPDSDGDEDVGHPLSASQRGRDNQPTLSVRPEVDASSKPRGSVVGNNEDDDDDDEPPPSIVLGTQSEREQARTPQEALNLHGNLSLEAGPSTLRESVRLDALGRSTNAPKNHHSNEADDSGEEDYEGRQDDGDEEAGLMNPRARSTSSSSSNRRKDRGFFHSITRKVRKRAERIQAEHGPENGLRSGSGGAAKGLNPRERALWQWGTLQNMDEFLQEVSRRV